MIEIRQAELQDSDILGEISLKMDDHHGDDYFERCFAEQNDKKRVIFIANNGEDVAYGMLNFMPRYALYKKLDIPEIQDLNVIPDARRQGIASAMVAYCEVLARDAGHEHIGISVALHSKFGPAQRLYAKLGYLPDGFGISYDREPVSMGEMRPIDDDLCLMMVKQL